MTFEGLTWIVVVNGAVQLAGLVLLGVFLIRGQSEIVRGLQEITRMTRAMAGLVYQEEEKTRALLQDLLKATPGGGAR